MYTLRAIFCIAGAVAAFGRSSLGPLGKVKQKRPVATSNNLLLETDGMGSVEAEFTYIPEAYA
ncbi:MAG: hypothetical protein O2856_08655 [Planctomycetota bacterium]|nr:hypothetical protein [Planctomycetota bacterium]